MPTKRYIKKLNGYYIKDEDARNDIVGRVNRFATVAAMQAADKLSAGEVAATLGFYTANDGGGAYYEIKASSGSPDGKRTIGLNGGLIAELIVESEVNIKSIGVRGDGSTDDADNIQAAIDLFPNKTIYFPDGIYLITKSIKTPAKNSLAVSLKLDNYAVVKADAAYSDEEAMICLGGKSYDDYYMYDNYSEFGLTGGTIDCNDVASGISVQNAMRTKIKGVMIRKCPSVGIDIKQGVNNNSADARVEDCTIMGDNNTEAIGLNVAASDNLFMNIEIFHCKYGVYITGGGNHFNNVHCIAATTDLNEYYEDMVAFYFKGGNYNYFNYAYSDQFATAFLFDGMHNNMISDAYVYYWADDFAGQHTAVKCTARMTGKFNNLHCRFPAAGTNTILKVANTGESVGHIKTLSIHNVDNLNDANDLGYDPRFNLDTQRLTGLAPSVGSLSQNNIVASEKKIDLNLQVSGIEVTQGTNTVIATLPIGWRPSENVQITPVIIGGDRSKVLTSWITTGGGIILSSATDATGLHVNFKTSYKI